MQFSSVLVAAAAVAFTNAAQFTMTASQFVSVKTGTPFDLTWSNATGPVTLLLKNGAANDLKTVETIASGLTGTSYSWTPESTLPSGTYAFEIDDSGAPNYSVQFTLAGSASSSVSSSSASSTGSSTSSGSSTTSTGSSTSSGSTTSSASTSTATRVSNSTSSTGSSTAKSTSSGSKTSSSTGSSTSSTSSPSSLSGASNVASPLAFVLLAVAALMTLN